MTGQETSLLNNDTAAVSTMILREVMQALRAGDVVGAAARAEAARQHDFSSRVLMVFAAISHAVGRDADALTMLDQAMKQSPSVGNYPDAAAAILLKLGRKADGLFNLKLGTHLPSDPFLDEIIGDFFGNIKDIFDSFVENRPLATARLMMQQGLYGAAIRQLETYIGVSGGDGYSFALIIECAIHLGQLAEAKVAYDALVALAPTYPKRADYALGIAVLSGDAVAIDAAIAELRPLDQLEDALDRYRLMAISPFIQQAVVNQVIGAINDLVPQTAEVMPFDASEWPAQTTVGFVCTSVDSALEALLLALKDHLPIKLYILGTGNSVGLQRVKAGLDDAREVASIDDATLIEMIRLDQVTVLFDCVGAGPFARPGLWRARMAPIQVLWAFSESYDDALSYDYRLIDDPAAVSVDRVIALGVPLRLPLPPAELMGRVVEARSLQVTRDEDAKDQIRLLAPHPGGALTDQALETYISILTALPTASLAFVALSDLEDPLVHRVLILAQDRGVAERIDLISPSDFAQSRYELLLDADLILDSFPYGNTDIVSECAWINCPVLTLLGDTERAKASALLLNAIGMTDLIARSVVEYREKAINLLTKPGALQDIRSKFKVAQKEMTLLRYDICATALASKIESISADWRSKNS